MTLDGLKNFIRARSKTLSLLALALICVVTIVAADRNLTREKVTHDGFQNYRFAHELLLGKPLSARREPLPQILLAGWLYASFPTLQAADFRKTNGRPQIVWVKRYNLVWALLIVLAGYAATVLISGSRLAGLAAAALCGWSVSTWHHGLNSMYTEMIAAAFLLLIGLAATLAVQRRSLWAAAAFGAFCACLAMTKALAFPLFVVAAPMLGVLTWIATKEWRRASLLSIVAVIAFIAAVAPWMATRTEVDNMRGAVALHYRAIINEMPPETYRAAFYVWAPPEVRKPLEVLFGFSPADMEEGGAGQPFNRSRTSSFYEADKLAAFNGRPDLASAYIWKVVAERTKRARELAQENALSAGRDLDRVMLAEARRRILDNPGAHVAAMLPLAWYGLWVDNAPYWLAPLLTLSLPLFMLWAIFARRPDAFAFGLVPLGFYLIYLLATNMLARYATPIIPATYVCLVVLCYAALTSFSSARKVRRDDELPFASS